MSLSMAMRLHSLLRLSHSHRASRVHCCSLSCDPHVLDCRACPNVKVTCYVLKTSHRYRPSVRSDRAAACVVSMPCRDVPMRTIVIGRVCWYGRSMVRMLMPSDSLRGVLSLHRSCRYERCCCLNLNLFLHAHCDVRSNESL